MFEAGALKVLCLIPEHNRLAIALVVRQGGVVEGVLRNHTVRDGQPVNAVAVGMTKEEFYGTGIIGRVQQSKQQEHEHEPRQRGSGVLNEQDVHSGSDQPTGQSDSSAAGFDLGLCIPDSDGSADGERGPDQLGVLLGGGPDPEVPRSKRVRVKRSGGKVSPSNRAGKTGRARKQ
jgi:hypothetical protein